MTTRASAARTALGSSPLAVLLLLLGVLLLFVCGDAMSPVMALWVPHAFDNNMVLQRGPQQAHVWGTAGPNSVVKLALDSTTYGTFADANGDWEFNLPPQPASLNHTIILSGDGQSYEWSNVAFGDVYICSGQSNMEFSIRDAYNATQEIADAVNYPNMRLFTVAKLTATDGPVNDTTTRFPSGGNWLTSSPDAVNGPSWVYFSATCYLFGKSLYNNLGGEVPLGLIMTCWGGTRIETWTSPAGIATCGAPTPANASNPDPDVPSELWNGMIAPLTDLRVTGVAWYQGESNVLNATNYACRFPAMIMDWRAQFNNENLFFTFVLLAAFKDGGGDWAPTRQAQLAALDLPYVAVASAQDLGDDASPFGGIHPRNKSVLGERLALTVQSSVYTQSILSVGPSFDDIVWPISSSPVQTVILRFSSDDPTAQQLHLAGTSSCTACCSLAGSPIALQLSDGTIMNAAVETMPDLYMVTATVDLSSMPEGTAVTAMLLNWVPYPECGVYNTADLPHLPAYVSRM